MSLGPQRSLLSGIIAGALVPVALVILALTPQISTPSGWRLISHVPSLGAWLYAPHGTSARFVPYAVPLTAAQVQRATDGFAFVSPDDPATAPPERLDPHGPSFVALGAPPVPESGTNDSHVRVRDARDAWLDTGNDGKMRLSSSTSGFGGPLPFTGGLQPSFAVALEDGRLVAIFAQGTEARIDVAKTGDATFKATKLPSMPGRIFAVAPIGGPKVLVVLLVGDVTAPHLDVHLATRVIDLDTGEVSSWEQG